jgi:tetratricopeptide (TPR) repeat protein
MKRIVPVILLTFSIAVGIHYRISETFRSQGSLFTQMLYLPSGKYLKPVSFGYYSMLADAVFLWSIQYYGDPGFHPKMEYLKHTYDIIAELDPPYIDAYQTGALFMFYEGRNPKAGLALLDKGIANNPKEWILPVDAGFYCMMMTKDYKMAADYFRKASQIPGVPQQAKRVWAVMDYKAGDKKQSYEIWKEVYESTQNATVKQSSYQHLHDLKVMIDVEDINAAIAKYKELHQRPPLNLAQLSASGILKEMPTDPDGDPYEYDPSAGIVAYNKRLKIYQKYQ